MELGLLGTVLHIQEEVTPPFTKDGTNSWDITGEDPNNKTFFYG